ncbi:protein jag [Fictibacillus sp. WQ 8-8]|uniref:RNA-binding cell elongation regulator Jag/EloR n=1 Tax=unclassified Fictibacillus TaxID=2644029 RepID=UPI0006A7ECD3|nr:MULTISPECIES: RNA-binding cell elongation regulator Jag/EloR [unclassified Fictibacillus]MCQ6265066.1 protein jag [Fictibacillus sp. WQ 8-8]MED2972349.1 RNA-binding cell elongation regulator Jag/EloR [Fictibacillus sp. B-59209]SFE97813.1 spoIIIJ-associated protein [Bacillus sp. OV194]
MKQIKVTGKTVEEAVSTALAELHASKEEVEVKVLEESKRGFLGFGGKPALIEVSLKPDPVKLAVAFLQEVTDKMGVPVTISLKETREEIILELTGEKIAILIGKRGQTLNSLQYLTNLVANNHSSRYLRIIIDAENYRERRRESLERLAVHTAQKVSATGKGVALEPMPSNERKAIHMALRNNKKIETTSEGAEPFRKVIIRPLKK